MVAALNVVRTHLHESGENLVRPLCSHGVGVDTNEQWVRAARARGLTAVTPDEFQASAEHNRPGRFDTILFAHVAGHMTSDEAVAVLQSYELLLGAGGRLILIPPQ